MEPTELPNSLKSFCHLSCSTLWGRISPEITEMLVMSLQARTPRTVSICLTLWQEDGSGHLRIPKETLPFPISARWESSLSNQPCTCFPNCFLPGAGAAFQGAAETREGAAPQPPQLDQR